MVIHVIYKCVLVFLLYLVSCIDVGSGNVDQGKSFLMVVFPFWRVAGLVTGSPGIAHWASPLDGWFSRKNIFCQKIFDNFFSFQATEMVLTSKWGRTSFPYFGVKLSCFCLMIAYRKKLPKITLR